MRWVPDFDPYLTPPEGDLTSGRGLVLLEFARKWRQEAHQCHAEPRARFPRTNPLRWLVEWLRGPFAAQGGAS